MARILFGVCLGAILIVATLAALVAYFVMTPDIEAPDLSGAVTTGSIETGGQTRTYRVYTPKDLQPGAPLVLVLHGSGESGAQIRIETGYGFERLADANGFAVAYPDAFEGFWNACNIVGDYSANALDIDDVGFLTHLVDKLVADFGVDPGRVFATGSSRGAAMTYRLALEAPARFRAVAAVSSSLPVPENFKCAPKDGGPLSVMIMNGVDDPLVPFEGGEVSFLGLLYKTGKVRPVRETARYFADRSNIDGPPEASEADMGGGVRIERALWRSTTGVEVELVAIHGGGHGIPQPYRRPPRVLGPWAKQVNGPEIVWGFFARQR